MGFFMPSAPSAPAPQPAPPPPPEPVDLSTPDQESAALGRARARRRTTGPRTQLGASTLGGNTGQFKTLLGE